MKHRSEDEYRQKFTEELARHIGCDFSELPPTTTKDVAAKYLGLTNKKTLNVWHSTGRHGIAMVKVGRYTQPTTDWLVELKMAGLSVAGEVA